MTTIPLEIERGELVRREWVLGVDRATDEETVIVPQLIDGMQRQIHAGDVISWRSGGYFSHYICFGLVLSVIPEQECIRVINQNGNKVTIWRTYLAVILAREGDYSSISNEYLVKFGVLTE
jgi:hypothetical protein